MVCVSKVSAVICWPPSVKSLKTERNSRALRRQDIATSSLSQGTPFYTSTLNRAAELRSDANFLEEAIDSSRAKAAPVWKGKSLLSEGAAALPLLSDVMSKGLIPKEELIFLGLGDNGDPIFSVDIPTQEMAAQIEDLSSAARFAQLRAEGPSLAPQQAALLGLARSMVLWSAGQRFCGVCGATTAPYRAGHARKCTNAECSHRCYPRLDPAIIVQTICGDFCLLGHNKRWVDGRYSLLAGFAEIGETLEMAVAREVFEEAGVSIPIEGIRSAGSQPWPFPSSLMLGYTAAIPPPEDREDGLPVLQADGEEITDVRWFHWRWLQRALSSSLQGVPYPASLCTGEEVEAIFSTPDGYSIARNMLDDWVATKSQESENKLESAQAVPEVVINGRGDFKFILVELRKLTTAGKVSKTILRGDARAAYHTHILEHAQREVERLELQEVVCVGGGRITYTDDAIKVYGHSSAFGPPDYGRTMKLLRAEFPFHDITHD